MLTKSVHAFVEALLGFGATRFAGSLGARHVPARDTGEMQNQRNTQCKTQSARRSLTTSPNKLKHVSKLATIRALRRGYPT